MQWLVDNDFEVASLGDSLVKLRAGQSPGEAERLEECARHLARYKLPKQLLFLDEIVRSPSGKADYRWARSQVE